MTDRSPQALWQQATAENPTNDRRRAVRYQQLLSMWTHCPHCDDWKRTPHRCERGRVTVVVR
jgi:hypothetical protein